MSLATGKAKLVAHARGQGQALQPHVLADAGHEQAAAQALPRAKKGRYSLTLTPQSVNFVPGTPVSAGRVSVPKPPKAKKRTSRRARFIY